MSARFDLATLAHRLLAYLWLGLGHWADRRGLAEQADILYRIAGAGDGTASTRAWIALGQRLLARGRFPEAAEAFEKVVAAEPRHAHAWCALGVARRRVADMPAARAAYEQALAINADYLEAQVNLGEWHLFSGDTAAALAILDEVLTGNPEHQEALTNKIAALNEAGRHSEAEALALEALRRHPQSATLHVNLGNIYTAMMKAPEAASAYAKALELDPESEDAALNQEALLGTAGLTARRIERLRQQILVRGESPDRLLYLASAQIVQTSYSEAKDTCKRILVKYPEYIAAVYRLSVVTEALGDTRETMALTRRFVALNPDHSVIHSNIPYEANYFEDLTRQEVFELHRDWAARHETPLLEKRLCLRQPSGTSTSTGNRRLRVGYMSGDFFLHPVGTLLRDILRNHDKSQFEIWCYSQLTSPDFVTEQIKSCADHWQDCFFLTDVQLAERIVEDNIDILVDLSGHTGKNRLRVFAMRPAPIQVTWLGYYHSTGLSSIDYFITDPYSTPPDSRQLFSEQPVYLPHSRFCFSPQVYMPPVDDLPCERNGFVTFGSFNRLSKITPVVVEIWSAILSALPESRLILKTMALKEEECREKIRARFAGHGIAADRLDLRGPSFHDEMLAEYGEIDIGLDPFPFNGGMTTMEALWMGVPVIALRGNTVVSLQSASLLTNIGLPELTFDGTHAYTAGAIALARNRPLLDKLRRQLRLRMARSPICQPELFTHELEFLYSRMWQAWNDQTRLGAEIISPPPEQKKTVLHVGCGEADRRSMPECFQGRTWHEVRLDIDPDVLPDVAASILDMSAVADNSVDAVFSSHNLEHLYPHEVLIAIKEFRRVLKDDGFLALSCHDLQSLCALVVEDKLDHPLEMSRAGPVAPLDIIFGSRKELANGNLCMAHKTGFTLTTLEKALIEGGFETSTIKRGSNHTLMAMAYPVAADAERIRTDMASCWPTESTASIQ